jgi:hypothetical protein
MRPPRSRRSILILAAVLFAWRGGVGAAAARDARLLGSRRLAGEVADVGGKQIDTDAAQAATLAFGRDVARQLTPVQLILLGALTGFVAGRKI